MDEAGGGIDRSHEYDKEGVEFYQDGADGVSLLGQAERPVEAVPGPERPYYPQQQRAVKAAQCVKVLRCRRGLRC